MLSRTCRPAINFFKKIELVGTVRCMKTEVMYKILSISKLTYYICLINYCVTIWKSIAKVNPIHV